MRILLFENHEAHNPQENGDSEAKLFRLAPEAVIIRADDKSCRGLYESQVEEIRGRNGGIDIIGYTFSTPERLALATKGRAEQISISDKNDGSVVIAAAGGSASGFPASSPVALAVGICDEEGQPIWDTQDDPQTPALFVPQAACRPAGKISSANDLRAAAVYIVSDLAALWIERLRAESYPVHSNIVRAALLASSVASGTGKYRIADANFLAGGVPFAAARENARDGQMLAFNITPAGTGPVHIAAVPGYIRQPGLWAAQAAEVTLRVNDAEVKSGGWAVIEPAGKAQSIRVEVTVKGAVCSIAVVAAGASSCRPAPTQVAYRKRETIVGISVSHDASACVLRDGKLERAIQLERLTRKKRDGRPYLHSRAAIDYCLASLNINEREVDRFAFNIQNLVPEQVGLSHPIFDQTFDLFDPFDERAVFVSHHLAHAFAAFFSSPFNRSAVFVADGSGGSVIEADDLLLTGPEFREYLEVRLPTPRPPYHVQSSYVFGPEGYRLIERETARSFHPMCGSSSLGETYAAVSQYVFGDWQEGGKLMGLAPYGDPQELSESFLVRDINGNLQFASEWKRDHRRANTRLAPLEYRHLAARVQRDLEEALIERVRGLIARTGETDVAYAGGVALNSVANHRLLCEAGVRQLYVQPASHDAGISVGAQRRRIF